MEVDGRGEEDEDEDKAELDLGPDEDRHATREDFESVYSNISTISDEKLATALRAAVGPLGYAVGSVDASTACVWEGRFVSLNKDGGLDERALEVLLVKLWKVNAVEDQQILPPTP